MIAEIKAEMKAEINRKWTGNDRGHETEMKVEMDRKWAGNESGHETDMKAEMKAEMDRK